MSIYRSMSVRAKMLAAFLLVIFLTCIISAVAVTGVLNNLKTAAYVDDKLSVEYTELQNTVSDMNAFRARIFTFNAALINFTKEAEAEALAMTQKLEEDLEKLTDPKHQDKIDVIKEKINYFIKVYKEEMQPFLSKGYSVDSRKVFTEKVYPAIDEAEIVLSELNSANLDMVKAEVSSMASITPVVVILAVTVIAIIMAMLIAVLLSGNFVTALKYAVKEASHLAKGDLSRSIISTRKDEFGEFITSLALVRDNLAKSIGTVKSVADKLNESVNVIGSDSEEMGNFAQDSQSRSLTVAAAADEMVSTTADIAKNCEGAAELAHKANNIASDGFEKIKGAINNIHDQVEKSKHDASQVQQLVDQAQKVGSIVETISDIANQTNLLALNAAIEAARAGEAGKGFAVVADEVRALASRTSASTSEITKMVGQIQEDAHVANEAMQSSVVNMDQLANEAGSLETVLQDISTQVSNVNGQITQIATAAEEQTTATSEISSNMHDITRSSEKLTGKVGDVTGLLNESNQQIKELVALVDNFKI